MSEGGQQHIISVLIHMFRELGVEKVSNMLMELKFNPDPEPESPKKQ